MSLLLCGKILTVGRNDALTDTEIPPEAFWAFPRFGRRNVESVCRVQNLEGRYHLCYLCLSESLAGKQDHNQQVCVGTVGLSVC